MGTGGRVGWGSLYQVSYLETNVLNSLTPLSHMQTMHMHIPNNTSSPFRSVGSAHESIHERGREKERESAHVRESMREWERQRVSERVRERKREKEGASERARERERERKT